MSTGVIARPTGAAGAPGRPWGLWRRQVAGVLRMEMKKALLGRRALPVYFLALAPIFLQALWAVALFKGWLTNGIGEAEIYYANTYQGFILRFIVFSGCAWIFTNLVRGEILDRSLHYYFLCPIRRDVLIVGKFVAGWATSTAIFLMTTALTLVLTYAPYGTRRALDHLVGAAGLQHSLAYLGVTALACLGYGAVFLATSLFFRNPMIPAIGIFGWELLNFLLPPLLKKISVIYYLISLCPVPVSQGLIAMMAEPTSAWISVPGFVVVTVAVLFLSRWRIGRTEISYGTD